MSEQLNPILLNPMSLNEENVDMSQQHLCPLANLIPTPHKLPLTHLDQLLLTYLNSLKVPIADPLREAPKDKMKEIGEGRLTYLGLHKGIMHPGEVQREDKNRNEQWVRGK